VAPVIAKSPKRQAPQPLTRNAREARAFPGEHSSIHKLSPNAAWVGGAPLLTDLWLKRRDSPVKGG